MVRTFADGITWIRSSAGRAVECINPKTGGGLCKVRAREGFLVASNGSASAAQSWEWAPDKHRDTNPKNAPAYSFGWMTGGGKGSGHVVVNLGGGRILTPGGPADKHHWYETTAAALLRGWPNLRWAGWTRSIDGKFPALPVVEPTPPKPVAATKPGTRKAPGRRVFHSDRRIRGAGGTFGDSRAGSKAAAREHYDWIDCNGHLMHRTAAGLRKGRADTDVVWVNAHGAPFNPSWLKGKLENLAWLPTKIRHPRLRSARSTFRQNARLGISTEWEVKDLHPLTSEGALNVAFSRLAASARAAYGADWQKRVTVKVLTDLSGGLEYAKKICKHAHAAGIPAMILARGDDAHRVINEPYIDYNRGGKVA
jgi:hypothetical protein